MEQIMYQEQQVKTNFLYKVYAWMAAGLAITAITSYLVASTPLARILATHMGLFFVLFLVQLGLVLYLNYAIQRMSVGTAIATFVGYSIVTGITFSTLFLIYTLGSLFGTFGIAAGMFGAMAIYGYITKADLSSLGNILLMALIGLIIGFVVNMFTHSTIFNTILSGLGVIIFAGLTAYDIQKLKRLSQQLLNDGHMEKKIAILGALTLYLDFINLFLNLLTFTGRRRD
jgi:FtsH-binding integral membrane protein